MITKWIWEKTIWYNSEPIEFLLCLIASIFTIPVDIVLLPLEIITFIIYKIYKIYLDNV